MPACLYPDQRIGVPRLANTENARRSSCLPVLTCAYMMRNTLCPAKPMHFCNNTTGIRTVLLSNDPHACGMQPPLQQQQQRHARARRAGEICTAEFTSNAHGGVAEV
mmetsp:Transcript_51988/g.103467  ORF Transcript_51988/g.103467 Transcript_51988/m.103467 type:complete len:107 (-) Transcript_51988:175-495(-)